MLFCFFSWEKRGSGSLETLGNCNGRFFLDILRDLLIHCEKEKVK